MIILHLGTRVELGLFSHANGPPRWQAVCGSDVPAQPSISQQTTRIVDVDVLTLYLFQAVGTRTRNSACSLPFDDVLGLIHASVFCRHVERKNHTLAQPVCFWIYLQATWRTNSGRCVLLSTGMLRVSLWVIRFSGWLVLYGWLDQVVIAEPAERLITHHDL
ncbi:hypothetical protein DL93DRAFT_840956 [Clavulina sp. PMI_390]|nr:hypothetical protein DL93DRAFT_840956 [Clavulina sp. PMI_390]